MKNLVVFGLLIVALGREAMADDFVAPKDVTAWFTVYVPTGNGKLEKRQIKGALYGVMPTHPTSYARVVAERALPLLFQYAPTRFPAGTRLTAAPRVEKGSKVIEISLSREFWHRGFWNNKAKVSSAVYAIVNTAVAYNRETDYSLASVQFLKDGEPVRNLANLDLRKPLHPRYEMVTSWDGDAPDSRSIKPNPLWILPPGEREAQGAEAFIGGRPSLRSGERSALRWLSRLLQQKPRAQFYRVEWWAVDRGLWWAQVLDYSPSRKGTGSLWVEFANNSIDIPPPRVLKIGNTVWIGLDDVEIHAVARKGGTLKAFDRYARERDSL